MIRKILAGTIILLVLSIAAGASSAIKVGVQFPPLKLKAINSSSSVPINGPQIVTFFASWSKTCLKEIKALKEIQEKFKKQPLNITAVSFDSDKKALSDFLDSEKITFAVMHDAQLTSPGRYQILVIPTTYIIKADGTIKNIFVDFDSNVNKAIEASLKEEFKK
ncbi:MAG: TlpA family protein disulfide reductase [Candidatus Saganbacteria bacterium]|nr:TlpA family protein disulfide reductase [Candidatus Saganbacteria bacterium]